ncbi:hypothetical protein PENSPDRAFT_581205 [Peniophora sp. CONT]|nr:hypothetical protein PENSPDRAFT_581205 [Peniophora sp. CONT]
MAKKANARSPSPESNPSLLKRLKLGPHADAAVVADPAPYFAPDILQPGTAQKLNGAYAESGPYKHAVVETLFRDDLLEKVKDEVLNEIAFTVKETDIYRVHQTGDLASLNFLTPEQVALFPNLLKLRDALYSPAFRQFVRTVTGCGPLSGSKQDMSINSYRKGCHLLNHDDVIGTRRVSYILYMPLPRDWKPEWGGALELYPVKEAAGGGLEPETQPSKVIPPSWNQFIFFEIQPGYSFHSVEEVVVHEEDGRQRLSISGWFHKAQEGEEGYEPESEQELKSSREQLASSSTVFTSYPETENPPLPGTPLSKDDISFLSEFLNPVYLQKRTMKALAQRFVQESQLDLLDFLAEPIAAKLRDGLRLRDQADGLGREREGRIPPHSAGAAGGWSLKGPPHKWRYAVLAPEETSGAAQSVSSLAVLEPDVLLRVLQDKLLASSAFRSWLAGVTQVLPLGHAVEARRFRPGLDYTLAYSEDKEARLDVVLGLTPQLEKENGKAEESKEGDDDEETEEGWESGEWGGWECYMAPHGEEDDPAVYRSGGGSKKENGVNGGVDDKEDAPSAPADKEEAEMEVDEEDEEEDNGTLLVAQPRFNSLQLVLRDSGLMHFVKYVSAEAHGSRWDVCGEYQIGVVEEEDDDE